MVGKLLAEIFFEAVAAFQFDALALQRRPQAQPVAVLFADCVEQGFKLDKGIDQMVVVHTFKRDAVQPQYESKIPLFQMNNVFSNVATDTGQIVLLCGLLYQRLPQ